MHLGRNLCFAFLVLAGTGRIHASSQPMGVLHLTLYGAADTTISIPLERPAVFTGEAGECQGTVLNLPEATDLSAAAAEVDGLLYLVVRSGALAGWEIPIVTVDDSAVLLAPLHENLDLLAPGDDVAVCPFWTPKSLFSQIELPDRTSLFVYDSERGGVNKLPDTILTYYTGYGWYGTDFSSADAYPLPRGVGMKVRLPKSAQDMNFPLVGYVPLSPTRRAFINPQGSRGVDNFFGLTTPLSVAIGAAGLEFADRSSIFVYEGNRGYNALPSKILTYYVGYGWYDHLFRPVDLDVELVPGRGYILRTPAKADPCAWEWNHCPDYLE